MYRGRRGESKEGGWMEAMGWKGKGKGWEGKVREKLGHGKGCIYISQFARDWLTVVDANDL
jgi:hypothetical protein